MSYFVQEIPKDVANGELPKQKWSMKMKLFAFLVGLITYILLVFSAKTIYSKHKRLDKMDLIVVQTEEMMHKIHAIDQNLAIKLERLEDVAYEDYDI